MADAAEEGGPKGGASESRSKKSRFILLISLLIAAPAISGGAWLFFLRQGPDTPEVPESITKGLAPDPATGRIRPEEAAGGNNRHAGAKKGPEDSGAGERSSKVWLSEKGRSGVNFGSTYSFKPFHLNLGNPLENRYLRLEIALEFRQGPAQKREIEVRRPQLRDAVIAVASRKTREFLLGPDGKDQLRLEILTRINQYMDMKIESVFITDLLIE